MVERGGEWGTPQRQRGGGGASVLHYLGLRLQQTRLQHDSSGAGYGFSAALLWLRLMFWSKGEFVCCRHPLSSPTAALSAVQRYYREALPSVQSEN